MCPEESLIIFGISAFFGVAAVLGTRMIQRRTARKRQEGVMNEEFR